MVSGAPCVIVANEPTIKGGSINPYGRRGSGDGDLHSGPVEGTDRYGVFRM